MTSKVHKVAAVCWLAILPASAEIPVDGYRVVHTYPHDATAFTQGLEYRGGYPYEGTGLKGSSSLRKVELETGKVVQRINLAPEFFGEGFTVINQIIGLSPGSRIAGSFTTSQTSESDVRSTIPAKGGGSQTTAAIFT